MEGGHAIWKLIFKEANAWYPAMILKKERNGPDPSYNELYRAGRVAAVLYIILGIVIPVLLMFLSDYNSKMVGAATLQYIAGHRIWWVLIQA